MGETYLLYGEDIPENKPRLTLFQWVGRFLSGGEDSASLAAFFLNGGESP